MERIENDEQLQMAIKTLEDRKEVQLHELKRESRSLFEAMRPINLIKSTLKEAMASPEVKSSLLNTAIGMGSGFVAKKLFLGGTGLLSKLLGPIVQKVVSSKVTRNADDIKSAGSNILKKIFKRSEPAKETS